MRPRSLWDHLRKLLGACPPGGDADLEVAVNKKVGLKVVVVLSERINKLLCYLSSVKRGRWSLENLSNLTLPSLPQGPTHLKPANVEEEL